MKLSGNSKTTSSCNNPVIASRLTENLVYGTLRALRQKRFVSDTHRQRRGSSITKVNFTFGITRSRRRLYMQGKPKQKSFVKLICSLPSFTSVIALRDKKLEEEFALSELIRIIRTPSPLLSLSLSSLRKHALHLNQICIWSRPRREKRNQCRGFAREIPRVEGETRAVSRSSLFRERLRVERFRSYLPRENASKDTRFYTRI